MGRKKAVYTLLWIVISTIIGGFLAGAWLISNNYRTFGQKKKANRALLIGFALIIMTMILTVLLPDELMKYIGRGISIGLLIATYYWAKNEQKQQIEQYLAKGAKKQPWYKAIGIAILALTITFAISIILVALTA